jgi:transposase
VHLLTVRRLTPSERRLLKAKLRSRTLPVRLSRRYRIVAEAARGRIVTAIAHRVGCHEDSVYLWVHRFNASGFTMFERPTNPRGRVPILTALQIRELVRVALSRPADLGLPFTRWSIPKLASYCRTREILPPITDEWVRRLLRREGVTAQMFERSAYEGDTRASSASPIEDD